MGIAPALRRALRFPRGEEADPSGSGYRLPNMPTAETPPFRRPKPPTQSYRHNTAKQAGNLSRLWHSQFIPPLPQFTMPSAESKRNSGEYAVCASISHLPPGVRWDGRPGMYRPAPQDMGRCSSSPVPHLRGWDPWVVLCRRRSTSRSLAHDHARNAAAPGCGS